MSQDKGSDGKGREDDQELVRLIIVMTVGHDKISLITSITETVKILTSPSATSHYKQQ